MTFFSLIKKIIALAEFIYLLSNYKQSTQKLNEIKINKLKLKS